MNELNISIERRNFLKASGMLLGAFIVPSSLFGGKVQLGAGAKLGSSMSMPISYKGKTLGLKLTIVNNEYVIGTLRIPRGKKLTHFFIMPKGSKKNIHTSSLRLKGKRYKLTIDSRKNRFSSNIDGLKMGPPVFNGSNNDGVASAYGFWSWLADALSDICSVVGAAITWLTGDSATFPLLNGGEISVAPGRVNYIPPVPSGGFKSEPGLEESPNIWY